MDRILGDRNFIYGSNLRVLNLKANPYGYFVGFEATNITGETKIFVLWRNTRWPLEKIIRLCGRVMAIIGIEMQIGPAWNVAKISRECPVTVEEIDGQPVYGLYVYVEQLVLLAIIKWPFALPRNIGALTGQRKILPG